ncbi:c-type cytochrome biogenesis protein CcmI [Alteromonas sp. H39]|uniref:c-type cytochrome biogenesis protein CcmI n=1 Tax=Alteromonas sp. H39 TaxID=3389876 RepID=UPI0039E10A55
MSWSEFYLVVSGLITLVILLIVFPWLRKANHAKSDSLNNIQVVKQRLIELEREAREGLISEHDKRQASDELKLALVDETHFEHERKGKATLPVIIGAIVALGAGVVVYMQVNHLSEVDRADEAIRALPALSEKLSSGDMQDFTGDDVANLALAIRTRLRQTPDDDKGWMYLGRLQMSLGQDAQALQAIQRALSINPQNRQNRITYAQALMVSGDEAQLREAQRQLQLLLRANPENDNLALMMAVASAQLGDAKKTRQYFDQVRDKLPADSEMAMRLSSRLEELEQRASTVPTGSTQEQAVQTGFSLTITPADAIIEKIPDQGYLIVFAQDALSENRMPAAVIKIPLQSFPVTVTLSGDNAMMPGYSLTQLQRARLTARISVDEDVTPAPGELQGQITEEVINGEMISRELIIDKELM